MRADQLLVERGLAATRSQAQRLIAAGLRWHDGHAWRQVAKNGEDLPQAAQLQLQDDAETRYVSRGGLKLAGALDVARLDPRGWRCLDVGQSTGGFTDCLLQRGAAQVVGVDVGHGQLHERLRADPRVLALEKVNARELDAGLLQRAGVEVGFDAVVGDLSFISLTLVLSAIAPLLRPAGVLLMLVKPQFELQPGQLGKGGIVRDEALFPTVEQRILGACSACGLAVQRWFDSPIRGGDGNREFFVLAIKEEPR
jgi:23S rRNA (cytidine1920-2'-O)/16S rRNA (cytidine1409-2'-O)-methyltransferase